MREEETKIEKKRQRTREGERIFEVLKGRPGILLHAFNSSTREGEAGERLCEFKANLAYIVSNGSQDYTVRSCLLKNHVFKKLASVNRHMIPNENTYMCKGPGKTAIGVMPRSLMLWKGYYI